MQTVGYPAFSRNVYNLIFWSSLHGANMQQDCAYLVSIGLMERCKPDKKPGIFFRLTPGGLDYLKKGAR